MTIKIFFQIPLYAICNVSRWNLFPSLCWLASKCQTFWKFYRADIENIYIEISMYDQPEHVSNCEFYKQENILYWEYILLTWIKKIWLIQTDLEEERIRRQQDERTTKQKFILYTKRILINFLVLCVLVGSLAAIYFAAQYALTVSMRHDMWS